MNHAWEIYQIALRLTKDFQEVLLIIAKALEKK